MYLLLVILSIMCLSKIVSTQNCVLTATPPDSKSGCCGHSAKDRVTTSGTIARIDEYPWMGLVEYQKKGKIKLLCSAVLISGRYALSASQCFSEAAFKVATPVNVRFGEYDLYNDGPDCVDTAGQKDCNFGALTIPIQKYTVHPDYNKNNSRQNDIVLIRLARMVTYTDFIRPICLPSLDFTLKAPKNLYMTVAGWGAVNSTVRKSQVLRRVHVPYVDFYLCRHKYNQTHLKIVLSSGQLCAGGKNRDACTGDSGGPLMLLKGTTMEVVGLVSFGPHPCGQDIPGVYTKVYAYNDWIKTIIAADELVSTPTVSSTNTPTVPVPSTSASNDFYSDFIVFKE